MIQIFFNLLWWFLSVKVDVFGFYSEGVPPTTVLSSICTQIESWKSVMIIKGLCHPSVGSSIRWPSRKGLKKQKNRSERISINSNGTTSLDHSTFDWIRFDLCRLLIVSHFGSLRYHWIDYLFRLAFSFTYKKFYHYTNTLNLTLIAKLFRSLL